MQIILSCSWQHLIVKFSNYKSGSFWVHVCLWTLSYGTSNPSPFDNYAYFMTRYLYFIQGPIWWSTLYLIASKRIWNLYLPGTNVTNINVSIPDLKNIYFNDHCNLSFNFNLETKNNTWSKGKWKSILSIRNCRHAYVFISDCLTVN